MLETSGFPDPRWAADHGLVAVGGDFAPQRLLAAYSHGIFPWPHEHMTHAWFSPNPRMVLRPGDVYISRSLRKTLRQNRFRVTFDTSFEDVMTACAAAPRHDQDGTWINEELMAGFAELHRMGFAHSVETWRGDELAGGLYGLALGTVFCGESMFHRAPDASKVAFVHLAARLQTWSFRMIDCQVYNQHLEHLGARERHRNAFLDELRIAVSEPSRAGKWTQLGPLDITRWLRNRHKAASSPEEGT